jgi:leucyl aminopeptidase
MTPTLPQFQKIEIKQDSIPEKADHIDAFGGLVLLLPEASEEAANQTPWGEFLARRLADFPERKGVVFVSLPGGLRAAIGFVPPEISTFAALGLARKLAGPLLEDRPEQIAVLSQLNDVPRATRMAEALLAAVHAALFRLPKITAKAAETPRLGSITLFGDFGSPDIGFAEATAEGNNLARWLTHLPPNYLTPAIYRAFAETLAEREGWKTEFLDRKRLEKLGAGAFLSVVQASPQADAGILRLSYHPQGAKGRAVALVGKGICFDTGGTNLKSATSMLGMHGDMQGSAVALATLLALARLEFDRPVDCWLALAENHIGSKGAKCNDVVTAVDGTTIEIINTDAEGRMVLADTLALASREQPEAILDYATLTGACVAALGHRMSGAMSNRRDWVEPIIRTGEITGERVWPLPWQPDYDEDLESEAADVLQCRVEGAADHLYAARFLGRFVGKDIGWVHVDLSSSDRKGGLAHVPTEVLGFGVRFGTAWLRNLRKS